MAESKVLNLALESEEIIAVILKRIEARMRANCRFAQAITYAGFTCNFDMQIKFKDTMLGAATMVWDAHTEGEAPAVETPAEVMKDDYDSGDSPNKVRMENELDLPVEVAEGRRKVIRKMPAANFKKGAAV